MKIIVPASSANIGPGFDSVGLALDLYLEIEVLEKSDQWLVEHDLGAFIPQDENNLLVASALKVAGDLKPHHLRMTSAIPLARGLGSSSSVIVAGIELANQLANLRLSPDDKIDLATKIEGHPDNVAPAILGNLVVASTVDNKTTVVASDFPDAAFVAFIPNYQLLTADSRGVLPEDLSYKEAVAASSIANVAIAALLKGDLLKAGAMIESDLFHEKYRRPLVKEFSQIRKLAHKHEAYASYLSGAGPTVMVICPRDKEALLVADLEKLNLDGEILSLNVDSKGVRCVL
ncbi:homoserine kinase [Streptococcaceae bacterium ESL0729]|nr:homoserine kinase [Streptococcaceae bacterium ESL0729]